LRQQLLADLVQFRRLLLRQQVVVRFLLVGLGFAQPLFLLGIEDVWFL
jgi:hypothetical protein